MKKLIYILSILLLAIACSSDDNSNSNETETEITNPDDLDGDGVTNQQETVDNTDPENACSYNLDSQYYPSVSNAWKNKDCDGDGVTNENELDPDGNGIIENNGTSPKDNCDLVVANQSATPTAIWLQSDCDQDGVSNGQEIIDNTDIFDHCDFVYTNQDLEPSNVWNSIDCDNDGRNNAQEIADMTDPLDPESFSGQGSLIKEVKYFNVDYNGPQDGSQGYENVLYYQQLYTTNNNISLFDKTLDANGNILTNFDYDINNRLILVTQNNTNGTTTIQFTYNPQNQITTITKNSGGQEEIINYEYSNNIINGYNEANQLIASYTLNNENKIIESEEYDIDSTPNRYYLKEYIYNASNELTNLNATYFVYNSNKYIEDEDGSYSLTYSYNDVSLNPLYNVNNSLYLNFILSSEISTHTHIRNGYFSNKHLQSSNSYYSLNSYYLSYHSFINQSNNLPVDISINNYLTTERLQYYYE